MRQSFWNQWSRAETGIFIYIRMYIRKDLFINVIYNSNNNSNNNNNNIFFFTLSGKVYYELL